jgi:branched-chain amino acid transport system ATP-binding protein
VTVLDATADRDVTRPAGAPALELRGVAAGYGTTEVVRGLDLKVPAGSVVALLGPNGAGKTTTLKVASGLLAPARGRTFVSGQETTGLAGNRVARAGLCLIPEGRGIFPSLSVAENLRLMGADAEGLARALDLFPVLAERTSQIAGTMSGGQQQMLAVARAVICDPAVVLADEVSFGLAPIVVDQIFEVLHGLRAAGGSILLVEQYLKRALQIADYVYLLYKGEIIFVGEPYQLEGDKVIERYFGHQ